MSKFLLVIGNTAVSFLFLCFNLNKLSLYTVSKVTFKLMFGAQIKQEMLLFLDKLL